MGCKPTESEDFQDFMALMKENGPKVWNTLKDVGAAFVAVLDALKPLAGPLLDSPDGIAKTHQSAPAAVRHDCGRDSLLKGLASRKNAVALRLAAAGRCDLAAAVTCWARPVPVQVDSREIAWAAHTGNLALTRR